MSPTVPKTRIVWLYVLVVSMVYAQQILVNHEYKIRNDCSNRRRTYNMKTTCPTFKTTNQRIVYISCSLSSLDKTHYGYTNTPLSLRITDSSNNITELSASDFSTYSFQRVIVLDLSNNNIQKIHIGSLIPFRDLVELNLTMNSLTVLDNAYLSPLLKLQKLFISRNSINTVSETSFGNQLDLFSVDLSFNNISHIPKNTFINQKYLEVLLLQGNQIKQFYVNFPALDGEFSRLDLSYNLLETSLVMPEHFTDINLSHNNLTAFSLVVPPKVNILDLSYNYIQVIDQSSFVNAVELIALNLTHNLLTSIPTNSFKEVKKLQQLDLSHNLIHENSYGSDNNWNSFFLNFKKLTKVALDGNYWKCSDLKDFIYLITFNRAEVLHGSTQNTTNIHGIGCSYDKNSTNTSSKEITYNPSERIQSLINQQITDEFESLYLNYTQVYKLQADEIDVVIDSLNSLKTEILKLKMALNTTQPNATDLEQKLKLKIDESIKTEISNLKVALNTIQPNATNLEQKLKLKIDELIKTEISNLKVALNSLNLTQSNTTDMEQRLSNLELHQNEKTTSNEQTLLDSIKTEISKLKETLKLSNGIPLNTTQSSGNAGTIVTNICLVIVTFCLVFFIYIYYKNKRNVNSFESEHLNLV